MLSGKGCGVSKTARMLAQKQPYIKRVRNSSLVERPCAENVTGLNRLPKLWIGPYGPVVGERSVWGEVVAKAAVDYTEVRMPV